LLRLQVEEFVNSTFGSSRKLNEFLTGSTIKKLELPFIVDLSLSGYGAISSIERVPRQNEDPFGVPDGRYGLYDSVVIFDHQYRKVSVVSHRGEEHARQLLEQALSPVKLPATRDSLAEHCSINQVFKRSGRLTNLTFMGSARSKESYCRATSG